MRKIKIIILSMVLIQFGCISQSGFPIILQEKAADCGPVCLQMIGKYYGKELELEELRRMAKMTEEGTSLLGLGDAADSLGLEHLAAKISYQQLVEDVPLPAIIHWKNNHFLVVYKVNSEKVRVADPALGKVEYTKDEFCEGWMQSEIDGADLGDLGVVLLLEKTDKFEKMN